MRKKGNNNNVTVFSSGTGNRKRKNQRALQQQELANFKRLFQFARNTNLSSRIDLLGKMGKSYFTTDGGAKRNIFEAFGFPQSLVFADYEWLFRRGDISRTVVTAYPDGCWETEPVIVEQKDSETAFEKDVEMLTKKRIWSYLHRLDILSGIGMFGVLLLGFNDGQDLSSPVGSASELLFLMPYSEKSVTINRYDDNLTSPRYGMPVEYKISTQSVGGGASGEPSKVQDYIVHWSRIIHVAEGKLDSEVFGTPRIESVYNRLYGIQLLAGMSPEAYYRGGYPGFVFKADADADFDTTEQDNDALADEIETMLYDFKRYIKVQGIDVEQLAPTVVEVASHINSQIDLVAGATGIPKRILLGSERGELASSQDERAWNRRLERRRSTYVIPEIIEPFIQRLIDVGVVSAPIENWYVEWRDLTIPTPLEEAEINNRKIDTFQKYVQSRGDTIIPVDMFLKKFLGFSDEELETFEGYMLANYELPEDEKLFQEEEETE